MRPIEIDDAVFTHLQGQAIPYVETPNDTLRRLLKIGDTPRDSELTRGAPIRSRARKVNLLELHTAGLLTRGQRVHLRDYKGKDVKGAVAEVALTGLMWKGKRWSMSGLAADLLGKEGYSADAVRGPAHWFTDAGVSILDLWAQLKNKSK